MEQGGPVAKLARNWRGTSDLTPSIRPIGAAHVISTSRSWGTGGPLSCKTATRILNPDTIAIRTGGVPEGSVVIRGPDSRNRIGPNRCFHPAQYEGSVVDADTTTIHIYIFSLSLSLSPYPLSLRRSVLVPPPARFSSGPLNFRLFFELNRRVKSAKNN